MEFHGLNFIGARRSEGSGTSFTVNSPLDGSTLPGYFREASLSDVDEALQSANTAFSVYRSVSSEARAGLLERIADEIVAAGDELLERAHRETGLPLQRLTGERGRTCSQLKLFAQTVREGSWVDARIDTALPDRAPLPRPDLRRMLKPIGPVIVFGASNFPLAFSVAGGDTASALAAGNPVVVKAHGAHPGTSEIVAEAIQRAIAACQLPAGLFSMLHGSGEVVGIALVKHPLARAAGFTGSQTAGRALYDAAVSRPEPIPFFAEMSSLNPIFVLPGAALERGAKIGQALAGSVTMGSGQFCTKPGLVLGLRSDGQQILLDSLTDAIEAAVPATMLHGGIRNAFDKGAKQASATPNVHVLAQSQTAPQETQTEGFPTVLHTDAQNFLQHPELAHEVFGPLTVAITAGTMAELVTIAKTLEGQLTATLHGTPDDWRDAAELISILEEKAGRLLINGFPTGVEVSPAMNHGGPYPATSDSRFTSVGTAAILRFARPVCYQDFPQELLPAELRDDNPRQIWRLVDSELTQQAL